MPLYSISEGPAIFIVAMGIANMELVPFRIGGCVDGFIFQAMIVDISRSDDAVHITGKGWPEGPGAPETPPGMQSFIGEYSAKSRSGWIQF